MIIKLKQPVEAEGFPPVVETINTMSAQSLIDQIQKRHLFMQDTCVPES